MSMVWPVPLDRVYWLNSGESIRLGDRKLTAVRPPLFDNPTTIGIYDDKSEAFFSADCFGAIIPSPAQNADTTGDRKDRTFSGVAGEGPYFDPFRSSQPDGLGTDIGFDEGRELTTPPKLILFPLKGNSYQRSQKEAFP
jgi:hypothetical protein